MRRTMKMSKEYHIIKIIKGTVIDIDGEACTLKESLYVAC